MKPMNDYVILSEVSDDDGKIELLNKTPNAVQTGKPLHASVSNTVTILSDLPEGTTIEQVTVYYRAAEGMEIPDEELVAIPLDAIIAVKASSQ